MSRLPQIGGDNGDWGNILNDFLKVSHADDGTLKPQIVQASHVGNGSITQAKLSVTPTADNQILSTAGGALTWVDPSAAVVAPATPTTLGAIRLTGDLDGTAVAPLIGVGKVTGGGGGSIATGTITDSNIHISAAIAKSKLAPLAIANDDISVGAAIVQSKVQNLVADLAAKAPLAHAHILGDVTGLQAALDGKAALSHSHAIADITSLQATLDAKATTGHTHTAAAITDFTTATAGVIGDRVQAGSNVTVDYDAELGITTISAATSGGGGEPSTSVMSVAGRTGDVVLGAGDVVSGTFTTNRIPNLDTAKITTGTLDVGRIPVGTTASTVAAGNHTHSGYAAAAHTHSAADVASGTLAIGRIPTGTSSTTVSLGNHTHDSSYAGLVHTHDDIYYTQTQVDTAMSGKLNTSARGVANGVASLGSDGKLPVSQLPALAINDTFTVANQAAMLALTAQRGDMAVRTDTNVTYILASDDAAALASWVQITSGTAPVTSVAGKTGAVVLTASDVSARPDNWVPTSAQLPVASESARGAVELATTAEAIAGTDTSHAVTPAGLAATISGLGTPQVYVTTVGATLPGGLPNGTLIARYTPAGSAVAPVVTTAGTATLTTAGTTVTVVTTAEIPAGDAIVVAINRSITSANTSGTATVTVSSGATDTWTRASASRASTLDTALLSASVTTTIPVGTTVTVTTSGNSNFRAGVVVAGVSGVTSGTPVATSGDAAGGQNGAASFGANASAATLTAQTDSTTATPYTVVIGAFGIGAIATYTQVGAQTEIARAVTSAGSSDRGVLLNYKAVSTTGIQSLTLQSSLDNAMTGVVIALPLQEV